MKIKTRGSSLRLPLGQLSLLLVVFLVLAYAVCYSPAKALASDHRESPTADANGEGDITDMFAFLDPNNASQVVLIMNVNPFAVPAEPNYAFSPNFLYQFKISLNENTVEDLVIQALFTNVDTTTCASGQMVTIYGPTIPNSTGVNNTVVYGDPALSGCTEVT